MLYIRCDKLWSLTERRQLVKLCHKNMKTIFTSNQELLEVLIENGINITCDENMNMVLTDEDAERLESVVEGFAPAATCDYVIE